MRAEENTDADAGWLWPLGRKWGGGPLGWKIHFPFINEFQIL
jgi:hypothetical protein